MRFVRKPLPRKYLQSLNAEGWGKGMGKPASGAEPTLGELRSQTILSNFSSFGGKHLRTIGLLCQQRKLWSVCAVKTSIECENMSRGVRSRTSCLTLRSRCIEAFKI